MNFWEKLTKRQDPEADLDAIIEKYIREQPHSDQLDILFAVQTAGPEGRITGKQVMDSLARLEEKQRIIKLGNGYCACRISSEKVTAGI